MAITFDGAGRRIVLDSASASAADIWSRWVDWHASHAHWPFAFRQVGGDALGGGLFIPPYFFLLNGWRVRPMEASHTLIITGNLFVDGGGVPVVPTLGAFNVSAQYTVPVQAQGIETGGGGGGLTPEQAGQLAALAKIHGLVSGEPLTVSATQRAAGGIVQSIAEGGGVVTVTRTA